MIHWTGTDTCARAYRREIALFLVLIASSVLCVALLDVYEPVISQSPTSPVTSVIYPDDAHDPDSKASTPPIFPQPKPPGALARLFDAAVWANPRPWIVVGVVFFGGLAGILIAFARRPRIQQ